MKIRFVDRGIVQIDDARLTYRNFSGKPNQYNRAGERNFAVVIPNDEIAEALMDDVNEWGKGWNVHIKAPREEGEEPWRYLPVKVKFNGRGPKIYLRSGRARRPITEENAELLDRIDIDHVDLDIRPYDGPDGINGPFRSAYLSAMEVYQNLDRFEARYAEEEYPEE